MNTLTRKEPIVEELAEGGTPAPHIPLARPVEIIIIVIGVLMLIALAVNFHQNSKIGDQLAQQRKTQLDGIVRGYITRAVTCDLQKGLGLHESKGCSDPSIAPYRDALTGASSSTGASESKMTRELVCLVLQQTAKGPRSTIVIPPLYCPTAS